MLIKATWNRKIRKTLILCVFNSNAVGMAVAQPLDFEIDFARTPITGSAAWFFFIIRKFIYRAIFEIKNHVKKFLGTKKFHFRSPNCRLTELVGGLILQYVYRFWKIMLSYQFDFLEFRIIL